MSTPLFFFLDAARITKEYLSIALESNKTGASLYHEREEDLAEVGPYLFSFPYSKEFSDFVLHNGWGDSWGSVVAAKISLEQCRQHFSKFLLVSTEEDEELYFRFYDPRVLKMFLPTCDKEQVLEFFGPVTHFIVEGDTKEEAIRFWQENGLLKQQKFHTSEILNYG